MTQSCTKAGGEVAEVSAGLYLVAQTQLIGAIREKRASPSCRPSHSYFQHMFLCGGIFLQLPGSRSWNFIFHTLWQPWSHLCPREPKAVLTDLRIAPQECNWFKKLAWNFLKAVKCAQPIQSHKDQKCLNWDQCDSKVWHDAEFIPDLVRLLVGQQAGGPLTGLTHHRGCHEVPVSAASADCQILVFPCQADSKRKMCSGKHNSFCKTLGSAEVTASLPPRSLADLRWLCSSARVHVPLPVELCQGHSAVGCPALCFTLTSSTPAALFFRQVPLSLRKMVNVWP